MSHEATRSVLHALSVAPDCILRREALLMLDGVTSSLLDRLEALGLVVLVSRICALTNEGGRALENWRPDPPCQALERLRAKEARLEEIKWNLKRAIHTRGYYDSPFRRDAEEFLKLLEEVERV